MGMHARIACVAADGYCCKHHPPLFLLPLLPPMMMLSLLLLLLLLLLVRLALLVLLVLLVMLVLLVLTLGHRLGLGQPSPLQCLPQMEQPASYLVLWRLQWLGLLRPPQPWRPIIVSTRMVGPWELASAWRPSRRRRPLLRQLRHAPAWLRLLATTRKTTLWRRLGPAPRNLGRAAGGQRPLAGGEIHVDVSCVPRAGITPVAS